MIMTRMNAVRCTHAAAVSRPGDGNQQRRHSHHPGCSVYDDRRLQRAHLDRAVAVLPVIRDPQPSVVVKRQLVGVSGHRSVASTPPPCRRRRSTSLVAQSAQRRRKHHLLELVLQSTADEGRLPTPSICYILLKCMLAVVLWPFSSPDYR